MKLKRYLLLENSGDEYPILHGIFLDAGSAMRKVSKERVKDFHLIEVWMKEDSQ